MVSVEPASLRGISQLAGRLRESDLAEVYASHGLDGYSALRLSLLTSTAAYSVLIDGVIEGMFGVAPIVERSGGQPWMLGSPKIGSIPVTFFRRSRKYMFEFYQRYGYLENYVDTRNTLSIQWLVWLGFTLHPAQPFGFEQRLFHKFTMGGMK